MEIYQIVLAVLLGLVVLVGGVVWWSRRSDSGPVLVVGPHVDAPGFRVVVKGGRFTGVCNDPRCGWQSMNWMEERSAEARMVEHQQEHLGVSMRPISEFGKEYI